MYICDSTEAMTADTILDGNTRYTLVRFLFSLSFSRYKEKEKFFSLFLFLSLHLRLCCCRG